MTEPLPHTNSEASVLPSPRLPDEPSRLSDRLITQLIRWLMPRRSIAYLAASVTHHPSVE